MSLLRPTQHAILRDIAARSLLRWARRHITRYYNLELLIPGVLILLTALMAVMGAIYGTQVRAALATAGLLTIIGVALLIAARETLSSGQLLRLRQANSREAWALTQRATLARRQHAQARNWRGPRERV